MRIGFVGVGVMGGAMLRHLADAGHELWLYDRDAAAVGRCLDGGAAAGALRAADGLRALAEAVEVVFTMLPNGRVVRQCLDGGLLAGLAPGALLIDTGSSAPPETRASAALLAERGVRMIDAPVSGAIEGARSARLVFMVGGDDADVASARPLLELLGREIIHVGPLGAGHLMKTVNNLATALTWIGTIEAMSIGRAHGLDPAQMVRVLNVSTGGSFVSREKMQQHVVSGDYADPFKLALMHKDLGIAMQEARAAGLELPVTTLGLDIWGRAAAELGPDASITEIARWYRRQTGQGLER